MPPVKMAANCIFCKIIKGKALHQIAFESGY